MSSSAYVLDASALLAVMLDEPGSRFIEERLAEACIGAVNLSEVIAKLQDRGVPDEVIEESLAELDLLVIPFDAAQAMSAGRLRRDTRAAGLSLGDRACLALAISCDAIAVTTDRGWEQLTIPVSIELAR